MIWNCRYASPVHLMLTSFSVSTSLHFLSLIYFHFLLGILVKSRSPWLSKVLRLTIGFKDSIDTTFPKTHSLCNICVLAGMYQMACLCLTLPTAEILSSKNARAWVLTVSYLKKQMKIEIKILKRKKRKKNTGSCLEVAC